MNIDAAITLIGERVERIYQRFRLNAATHRGLSVNPAAPLRARQFGIVVLMFGLVLAAAAAVRGTHALIALAERRHTIVMEPQMKGTFRPRPAQFATLTIKPVQTMAFRTEKVTQGVIAIDDDLTTPVFSPYSGVVTGLIGAIGAEVTSGEPLLAVNASEFVQGENDVLAAAAALKNAQSQLGLAEVNEKRQRELYEAQGAALRDWEQSKADLVNAQSALRTAEVALTAARNRLRILGKSSQEIAHIESASEFGFNAEAFVRSPIGGTILQRQVGPGQYIQAGAANPVYTIGNLSKMWLIANVPEADAAAMRVGQEVEVRIPALPERIFSARLSYIGAAIDPNTRRLPVRAEINNPDRILKPQMFADFRIVVGGQRNSPAVPESAVVYEGDQAHVWVAFDDNSLAARTVRLGAHRNEMAEVVEGLSPGDRIVTGGTLFIDRASSGG